MGNCLSDILGQEDITIKEMKKLMLERFDALCSTDKILDRETMIEFEVLNRLMEYIKKGE